jgi:hemerythrin-like domain-containing protein
MRPSGVLMIEHRLIERFIVVLEKRTEMHLKSQQIDPLFTDAALDFFRIYADRTHHGKEEGILFRALDSKKLNREDSKLMDELINEHIYARKTVENISEANEKLREGNWDSLFNVVENFRILSKFYPAHIKKEDTIFFPAAMKYFSDKELEEMLAKFVEFDSKIIYEKYAKVIEALEEQNRKKGNSEK